ncbi:hypothetical protein McPS_15450 [Marichromatium sp. PS1]|uniref:cupin domain-containing protein n=1 Tax=Marichromatium sp. PS1 TaxID=3138932 RepID=UPI0032E72104
MQIEHWHARRDGALTEASMRRKLEARGFQTRLDIYPPGTFLPDHDHGIDHIDGVICGRMRVGIGERSLVLGPGDLVVIPRHTFYQTEVMGDEPVVSLAAERMRAA